MIKAAARKVIDACRYALTPTRQVTVQITGKEPVSITLQGPADEITGLLDRLAADSAVARVDRG